MTMKTEELVKRLRKPGIWNAPELWEVMEETADRLETILKAWEAYWLELGAPVCDATMIRVRRMELRRAITGETE